MDIKDNEYVTYSDKPKAISKEHLEKYGEDMLRKLGASDEQIAEAKEQIKDCDDKLDSEIVDDEDTKVEDMDTSAVDEKYSGKGEEDDLDLYMKDLNDYMSKNKKGREDIPARYRK